ncbi:hypothetical protein NN6n1_37710 [Shinella zoogloeoides]
MRPACRPAAFMKSAIGLFARISAEGSHRGISDVMLSSTPWHSYSMLRRTIKRGTPVRAVGERNSAMAAFDFCRTSAYPRFA